MNNKFSTSQDKIAKKSGVAVLFSLALTYSLSAFSAGGGIVTDDTSSLHAKAKKETYSPYAQRDFPDRPLWGDTHLHTA
ncbi:MAG: hypothetical protein KAI17_05265, partial [Thiotrichaceae bacterium]|nr:hypothetical protein [Thiotrichaceae bacterium]